MNNTLLSPFQTIRYYIDSIGDSVVFIGGIILTLILVTLSAQSSHSFKFQQKFSVRTHGSIV